jgi:hypothetical protein
VTPAATGPISRLAYATTEADAMALITEAVLRGASPDEAHEAFGIWQRIRREDVTTIRSTA